MFLIGVVSPVCGEAIGKPVSVTREDQAKGRADEQGDGDVEYQRWKIDEPAAVMGSVDAPELEGEPDGFALKTLCIAAQISPGFRANEP